MTKIKAILLDIDNTLLDFKECAAFAMRSAFKDWGLEYRKEYLPVFLEENNYYWNLFEDGEITREDIFKNRFKRVFERLGMEKDGEAFERTYLKYMYQSSQKVEGAKELLEYLSKKYPLYAASNAVYEEQAGRLTRAGLYDYFKEIFTSEEIGYAKPSAEFFDYVREQIGNIAADEMLIIGDSIRADISGGHAYGIRTCWYNPHGEPENSCADYTVTRLSDIEKIL